MDPLTFLPRRPVAVASAPVAGDPAPDLGGRLGGTPAVVSFLRHVGCPFAEATFLDLHDRAERTPEVRFVAVSHASDDATARWCRAVAGGPGRVELVVDEARALYGAWGLGPGTPAHFLGRDPLREVIRLSRAGIRNRHPVGTRWQTAGTFGVDAQAVVRFSHLPAHAGALPDLDAALAAVTEGTRGASPARPRST